MPIISLNVLGIKLNFLVDSGANKNQNSEAAFEIVKETEYYKETFAQYQGKNRLSEVVMLFKQRSSLDISLIEKGMLLNLA